MKAKLFLLSTLLSTVSFTFPAQADNIQHTQQVLSTRQCPRCDLTRAGLIFADLVGADLTGANLMQANLSRANLQGADLRGANLIGVSFNGANLAGAKLDGANLTGADLRGAYLTGATMQDAIVEGAYLQGAIGLQPTVGKLEDFYRWALQNEKEKDYVNAIKNFTRVIERKDDFAPAYFGRAAARAQANDIQGAIADARQAEKLFKTRGDVKSAEVADKFALLLEKPPEERPKKGGFGQALVGLLGTALQLFLTKFPIPFF